MSDISNPDAGIFPTEDSLGFQIIQEGTMPATQLPRLPEVPLDLIKISLQEKFLALA